MTSLKIPFLCLFFLVASLAFGQTSTDPSELLTGTWYLLNSGPETKDSLVYSRTSKIPRNWGERIEFNASNSFLDACSGRCGNDSKNHKDSGTWQVSGKIITTSVPIATDKSNKHLIVHLTKD